MKWSAFWRQRMTLRLRLALYTSGLTVLLCLELVVFINVVTALTRSQYLFAISFSGLLINMLCAGLGAYWIAGRALRPLRAVSATALQISANTLHTRLELDEAHDELRELGQAFDTMLERLEQAFEQQSRFVADAAHELRTPLAILRTNMEVIAADPQATLEDYQNLIVTLERSLGRLERLVSALLVLATEEQTIVKEKVALLQVVTRVVETLQPMAEEMQINLCVKIDSSTKVCGDEHLLELVFRNLLENAIRYNRVGGSVTITSESSAPLLVKIADTGSGIPEEAQKHIFERFYRVETSRSRHTGGAGLGLALVNHILKLQNGSVWLEQSSLAGSIFAVELVQSDC